MFPNYFILGVYPLPVSPCTVFVYNDILISSLASNGIEAAPPSEKGYFSWVSCLAHILNVPSVSWVIGLWTTWRNEVEEEGLGDGQKRKWGLSHFRGELSSRFGLGVVHQNLSKSFPKSNTLNLTTLTTQDTHFKPQSSTQAFCQHWQPQLELWSFHKLQSCSWRRHWPSKQKTSDSFHSNFRKPPWLWITGSVRVRSRPPLN